MNIVITMGGNGRRFREKGYNIPKYMIEVKGKTLFEWSLLSLENLRTDNLKYIFVVKKEDEAKEFLKKSCDKLELNNIEIIEIDYLTDGQATTALLAKEKWIEGNGLLIYNIDTHVNPEQLELQDFKFDGFIPCFDVPGEAWSFVKLDSNGNAVEVREKTKISNHATIGLYYFGNTNIYEEAYNEYYKNKNNLEKGEKYIAPLYNYLIEKGYCIRIKEIPYDKVQVIGTPEELEKFKNNNYKL